MFTLLSLKLELRDRLRRPGARAGGFGGSRVSERPSRLHGLRLISF
jgi:hypothetical protein